MPGKFEESKVCVQFSFPMFRLQIRKKAFEICVFDASNVVSTKTLLLKHYYRRQGPRKIHPPASFGHAGTSVLGTQGQGYGLAA